MKKRFSKLLLAVAMTLQLTPSSLGTIIANDSVAYSSEYIQIGMENQPAGTFEAASSDIPEGVEKLNVTVNVDGTVKDTKLLTFTSGTDPAKTEIAANDGYAIESVTLDGEAFNGSIGYNREVGENEKNLIVNVYTKASLTIHYQDANGHAIAADDVKEGKLNGVVPIEVKAIEGYTAVGEKVKDFTLTKVNNEITVKYEKSVSPAPKARMTTTNAKAGECSVSITKNCYKADGTYVDEKGVEYPVYLNADTLGPSGHKPHTVAFVPGQSSNNCQQDMYIGTYGPRNIHYVVIKYSPSSNEITYIRCDKYDGEEEDKNYYKVTYTDEYDKFLGEEAVLENTKPMKVPDMQESGYWTLQGETKQVDPKEYTVNGTTVFVYKYNPVTEIKATYHSTSNDDNFPKYFKYGIDQNIVVEKVDPLPNDHDQSGKHIFVGWVTSIDGYKGTQVISNSNQWNKIKSKIKYPGDTLGILKDDVHLYAVFADRSAIKDEKVTIRYAVNPDNSGKLSKTYETINEYTGTPEGSTAAANTGYEFVNWTDAEGNEVGTNAKFIPQKVDGIRYSNSVYYANFEKKESTVIIKYKSNDVNMGTVDPTYETLGEETGIAAGSVATAKKGYAFKNWTDQNGKIVSWEKEFKPAKVEGKNVAGTYTANFGKDDNGDNIPDDYQIKVTYSAVNGTIDSAHAGKTYHVTLFKDGKWATKEDGGIGTLTADQIATATAANGYRQNSLNWTPKTPTTSLKLNSDTEFKATFSKDYFKYRVEYYYDGELGTTDYKGAVEFEKEVKITPKKSVEYKNKTYALDKTENNPLKITSVVENNVIRVYYGLDENKDVVPDVYQIKVTYSAVNGTIDSAHAGKTYHVTLFKDGKWATAKDGGIGTLTVDQIATATAADGYRQNSLKWTPKTPTTSLKLNSDTEFKATFSKDYFKYRVEYYYDGELGTTDYKGAVEFEKEVSVTPKKSVEYENKTYALDKTENNPLKITSNEKNNVIKVYYGLDENKDVVPDIYQAKVTYSAVNGTIDSAHAGKIHYVTLFKDGKWATKEDGGIGTLTADQIATATAANGYAQNSLNWTPKTPTTSLKLNSDTEFKASFSKDYFKYRVEYYYDGELGTTDYKGAVEFEKEVKITPKKSVEYKNKTYALDKTENNPLKITSVVENNVIRVYYGLDENKDVVPDVYQIKVTYSAVNGTIDSAHAGKTYHVTLFKDGKWATAKDGGIGTLTADQIATATAANGYAQNSLNWTPDVPTTLLKLNSDTEFKATFSKDYFKYRVEYYYDGNLGTTDNKDAVEFEKEVSVTPKKSVEYENKTYALDKTENNPLKITSNVEKNVIRVYYGLDENKDVVPDDYQAIVTYKAVNGIVGFDKVYVTLFNNEGEWAKDGVGQLTKEQIPTTTPNKGYHFVNWTPATPVEGTKITRNGTTTFTANHAINTYSATVNYIDEDSGKEIATATTVADIEHGKDLDGNTYAKAIDGYAFTQAEKVTITQDNMAVNVYYSVDVVGTDPNNPDQPDGIPDKYQAEVTFAAVNGAVSFNRTYVTLYMDNVYSVKGIGFLSNQQIPTTTPNEGYHFVNWSPMEPAIDRSITKQGAAFTANHAINTYNATVRFIDEDNGTEIAPAETINGIEHGFILNGAAHRIAITGYAFTTADTAIIERDHAIVNVYYSVDTKGGEGNPDNTSDGIPDKYQVRFAYTAAENGSVNGTVIEYVTRPGHVTTAPVRPQALVDALADDGYSFVNWTADGNVYLNTDAIRNTYFTGDTVFTAGFAAVPVPVVPIPVVPTPPAVSPTVTPPAPVLPVAPLVTPPAVVPVVPAPAPAPAPGPTVEENEPERPKVEETEEVDENVTAKAGSEGSWALINLLCSGGTVLLGLVLLLSKLKKEEDEEEDKTAAMRNGNNKQSERYKRRKWLRAVSTVTAVVSVIVFFLTEDMSLAMVLIDKWTLLMAAFLIIQIIFVLFGRKWKELDEKAENTEAAHS
ncbi:MucBP domain-containing protein [[Clostridium] innocuum]|nr:MucBP domain-containing protein [[Clostridium] innocuum]MCR0524381.1 MucBP domain-containing protein [[Clostridium] innocuum]MCR0622685.1 MucBP domain-containing protein [[Clostridium] innocuum]